MGDRTSKTDSLFSSIVRNHSPYCEANGPIVQQGFVAARVRAIQGHYHKAQQGVAHPHIDSYLVPNWPRITNLLAPAKSSLASRLSKCNRKRVDTKTPSFSELHPIKVESSSIATTDFYDTTDIAAEASAVDIADENTTTILSPQAIPSSLAKSPEDWAFSYRQQGYHHESASPLPMLYPRPSVAAKLGSMVGNGLVGSDASQKAYSDQQSSDTSQSDRTEVVCNDQSQSERSKADPLLPLQRDTSTETKTHDQNRHQRSADQKSPFFEHNDPPWIQHSGQRKQGYETTPSDRTKMYANMSGFEDHEDRGQDASTPECEQSQRTGSLQDQNFSEDRMNHQLEPEKVSLSREIDRHLFAGEHASSEDKGLKLQQKFSTEFRTNDSYENRSKPMEYQGGPDCLSPIASTKSSRASRTSTTSQQPKQSVSRSTSWFAKLAGYKLVLVDKTPSIRLSRRTSEPAMNIQRRQHHHRHYHHRQEQPLATFEGRSETMDEPNVPSEDEPRCGKLNAPSSKLEQLPEDEEPLQVQMGSELVVGSPKSDKAFNATSTPHSGSMIPTDFYAPHSDVAQTHLSSESQRLPHPNHRENNVVISKTGSCHASDTPGNASRATSARDTSSAMPASSSVMPALSRSEHALEESGRESPLQKFSSTTPLRTFGIQTPSRQYQDDENPKNPSQALNWQTTSKGRGFRKVQVIISLDGADDVNVKAMLLKRLMKESSPRVACDTQDSEDREVSNSSDQVLLGRWRYKREP